jgi:predicted site-specific integrase-resolvase
MSLEPHFSLSGAAKRIGVDRSTLKRWLRLEGIILPRVRHGAKVLIRERDIERIVEKRRDARFSRVRA